MIIINHIRVACLLQFACLLFFFFITIFKKKQNKKEVLYLKDWGGVLFLFGFLFFLDLFCLQVVMISFNIRC